jgi:Trypsin
MKIQVTVVLFVYFVGNCVTPQKIDNYKVRYKKFENDPVAEASIEKIEAEEMAIKMLNGNNATNGQFPFSVRISFYKRTNRINLCSGSIISKNFVLSAGEFHKTTVYGLLLSDKASVSIIFCFDVLKTKHIGSIFIAN